MRRQILAEPDGDLPEPDLGLPARMEPPSSRPTSAGRASIVLYHVTADTTWSNLPLSGLFIDMLRRVSALAGTPGDCRSGEPARGANETVLAPRLTLDGFGAFGTPPANATGGLPPIRGTRDTDEHPPGFYGPADGGLAVNALGVRRPPDGPRLRPAPVRGSAPLEGAKTVDLRAPLFTLALMILILDTLACLWLGGSSAALTGPLAPRPVPRPPWRPSALLGAAPFTESRAQTGAADHPRADRLGPGDAPRLRGHRRRGGRTRRAGPA